MNIASKIALRFVGTAIALGLTEQVMDGEAWDDTPAKKPRSVLNTGLS